MRFDIETKRIIREGVPNEVNNWDIVAVQRAVELRQEFGGSVTAITMGPPQARDGLVRCMAQGADYAVHVVDSALIGSDTLATARVLAAAIGRHTYDLVLFGNFSVDAETGQVGPEVAEMLDLPQLTAVSRLDVTEGRTVRIERNLDDSVEVLETTLPVVVTVADGVASDTFPGREAMNEARDRPIVELAVSDLGLSAAEVGASGSPTWVAEIQIQESARQPTIIEDVPVNEAARQVVEYLRQRGIFDQRVDVERHLPQAPDSAHELSGPGVWVMVESDGARSSAVTNELLAAAQPIAEALGGYVTALLIGGPQDAAIVVDLIYHGADIVQFAEHDELTEYATETYASVLSRGIVEEQPYAILLPSTPNGRDLAARVAARLRLGLTGDAIGLAVDDDGRLLQFKPAFGGNVVAPILSKTLPNLVTVRPGVLEAFAPNPKREVAVKAMDVGDLPIQRVRRLDRRSMRNLDVGALMASNTVIGVGKGLGGPEYLWELEPLRKLLNAAYVTTRDVADAGWLPRQIQVGLTGRTVAPRLYIGVGIRGDYNHLVGLQKAGTLVCVNNNRRASIFRGGVDVAVLADWHEFIPELEIIIRNEFSHG